MQGNKYHVSLTQIGASKTLMAFAQMTTKLKATLKKWGKEAEESVEVEKHRRDVDRESILQGVSNDCGGSVLSSEMRYEYAHLEAAKKERNPTLVLPTQYENDVFEDEKDRAFICVTVWLLCMVLWWHCCYTTRCLSRVWSPRDSSSTLMILARPTSNWKGMNTQSFNE